MRRPAARVGWPHAESERSPGRAARARAVRAGGRRGPARRRVGRGGPLGSGLHAADRAPAAPPDRRGRGPARGAPGGAGARRDVGVDAARAVRRGADRAVLGRRLRLRAHRGRRRPGGLRRRGAERRVVGRGRHRARRDGGAGGGAVAGRLVRPAAAPRGRGARGDRRRARAPARGEDPPGRRRGARAPGARAQRRGRALGQRDGDPGRRGRGGPRRLAGEGEADRCGWCRRSGGSR